MAPFSSFSFLKKGCAIDRFQHAGQTWNPPLGIAGQRRATERTASSLASRCGCRDGCEDIGGLLSIGNGAD